MEDESSGWTYLVESTEIFFDVFGVGIVVVGILVAIVLFLRALSRRVEPVDAIKTFKIQIARAMTLGLEVLIAADIVQTVAEKPTIESMGALGLLVLVRTLLSWTLELEIEGRWPWQSEN